MPTMPNWKENKEKKELEEKKKLNTEKSAKDFTEEEYDEMEKMESDFWDAQDKAVAVQKKMDEFMEKKQDKADEENAEKNDDKEESDLKSQLDKLGMKNIKIIQIGGGKWGGPEQWVQLLLLGVAALFAFNYFSSPELKSLPLSEFMTEYRDGNFESISLSGESAVGKRSSGEKITTVIGNRDSFKNLGLLDPELQKDTKVEIKGAESGKFWMDLALSFLPLLLIIGLMVYSMKGMKGMGGFPFGGKKRGMDPINPDTTFADVAGQDEAKYELEEIVEFLKIRKQSKA